MRVSFEWEWEIGDFFRGIKQKYLDTVCHFKGHIWEKYKEPKRTGNTFYDYPFYVNMAMDLWDGVERTHTHTCKRCGEWKNKTIEPAKRKPKTVTWKRWSDPDKK